MEFPVRVSCVSYLNSKPFMYGLTHHPVLKQLNLFTDNPADCARKLIHDQADIGLVPVASIPLINNATVISDFCISADGNVKSVLLLSEVPLHKITSVSLDYQSMTSVNLLKILADKFWKINPEFLDAQPGYENHIKDNHAAVVIGDRALQLHSKFKYTYDLAGEWKRFTGLPFVFACWVSNKKLSPEFISDFNEALQLGISNLDVVIDEVKNTNKFPDDIGDYLKNNLSFKLDAEKKEAMQLFLGYVKNMNRVSTLKE